MSSSRGRRGHAGAARRGLRRTAAEQDVGLVLICVAAEAVCLKAPVRAGGSHAGIDVSLTPRAAAKTTAVRRTLLSFANVAIRRQTPGGSVIYFKAGHTGKGRLNVNVWTRLG